MKKKATKLPSDADTLCPVACAETAVGDRWTVLILRELVMGSHRFEEIQAQTEATPQMIAARLKRLQADGLLERRNYSKRPPRYEHHLTEKGDAFYPVLLALRAWGETWCKSPKEGLAVRYTHRPCDKSPGLGPVCQACGQPLRREDLIPEQNAYRSEREARWEAFKARQHCVHLPASRFQIRYAACCATRFAEPRDFHFCGRITALLPRPGQSR